ncbi:MAG: DUF4397 domain-containing protein [Chloroflexi bacterium]|nr:DUF4397 domain-containing protein [Chloroflexota bacterium]
MRKMLAILFALMLGFAALAPVALAQDDGNGDTSDTENQAYIRYANWRTDGIGADFYFDGEQSDTANLEAGAVGQWTAVDAGVHTFGAADTGAAFDEAGAEPNELELTPGQWMTVITIGSAEASNLRTFAVPIDAQELVPGTSMITFVNALDGETRVNFDRDGVPFVTELAPPGNADGLISDTSIPVDSETYTFTAYPTGEPDNLIGELADVDMVATNYYLLAVVEGAEGPELVMDETRFAEMLMARGDLEAPGTLLEAARGQELLAPFVQLLEETGLSEELTGEGPYTVFAPADFAVDEARSRLGDDQEALANWVRGHIVEGDLKFQNVYESESLTALTGDTLTIEQIDNTASVNGAEILTPNVAAMNGTLHIVGAEPVG